MAPTSASPSTWTLRFKSHKTTIVLHADPLESFDSLKEQLVHALLETHPDGRFNGLEIPSSPSNVLLARPSDIHNIEKGFVSITDNDGSIIMSSEPAAKRKKAGEADIKIKEACPKSAGLREGAVIAFKIRTENEVDYDPVTDDDWDVVMPSFEDQEAP